MKCKKCGKMLPENAKFCFECGAKVEQELICSVCGAKMPVGYKYCMECGSKLSDDDTVMEKNREEMDDIDWDVLLNSTAEDENDLEKLRDNIKQFIQEYAIETSHITKCKYMEVQKNVIWANNMLFDLRELSTIREMKENIEEGMLDSDGVGWWHFCWPEWERYCRMVSGWISWGGGIFGNAAYYITGTGKEATLHKIMLGTENKEDVKTWSEVQIFEDEENNLRILAHNLQEGGSRTKEWILLNTSGEVLWERENATALRVGQIGWALDYWPVEDMYNFSLLLDFYTGNVLLKKYCDYSYYTNKKTGKIIIAADRIDKNYTLEFPHLYHYERGKVKEFTNEEMKRYNVRLRKNSICKLDIPQFKEMGDKLKETEELLTTGWITQ